MCLFLIGSWRLTFLGCFILILTVNLFGRIVRLLFRLMDFLGSFFILCLCLVLQKNLDLIVDLILHLSSNNCLYLFLRPISFMLKNTNESPYFIKNFKTTLFMIFLAHFNLYLFFIPYYCNIIWKIFSLYDKNLRVD